MLSFSIESLLKANSRAYVGGEFEKSVEKIFNRGNGRLALFEFLEDEKIVLVNSAIANSSDTTKLAKFLCLNGMFGLGWKMESVSLGYPEWYRYSNLHSARKH